ncbi:Gfo/Idh/MocA family oxidoreductase [soil metagenome]
MTRPLRHVVVGVGASVFEMHRAALELPTSQLVGVTDLNPETGRARAAELGCASYPDYPTLLAETQPDVAVVLTPHPFHAPVAIACLEAGCHVLVEKPLAVEVSEADAVVEAAQRTGQLLAVNFQQRLRGEVLAAKRYLDAGRLGRVQHVDITKAWPRTNAYYRSATWRATWRGEGGGMLLNQAPHDLDLLCYLLGMPSRVVAWTRNLLHTTETEDTVQAMLEWGDGALGSFHISTAEGGRDERIEIVGTGGVLHIGSGRVTVERFEPDFAHYSETSPERFGTPEKVTVDLELTHTQDEGQGNHTEIYRNLHRAILEGVPLVCDGASGRMSLELANAMILSSYTRESVSFPLDRAAYHALLEDLKRGDRMTV